MTLADTSQSAALRFPNPSRSYDESAGGVYFWGYDQSMEVTLLLAHDALSKLSPDAASDEAGALDTFDANRDRIQAAAQHVYARRDKSLHCFTYTLAATDLDF